MALSKKRGAAWQPPERRKHMKKRCFALLLALILCLQLAPSAAAKDAKSSDIHLKLDGVTGGTAKLWAPDGTEIAAGTDYTAARQPSYSDANALTATATPDTGYGFSGWTVKKSSNKKTWTDGKTTVITGSDTTLTTETVKFVVKAPNQYLQITPTFSKRIKITLVPNSADKGSVTCTTENVDLNSFLPGSNTLALATTVKEGCSLTGWSVTYADGTAVPETAAKVKPDVSDPKKATLTTTSSLTQDITITAEFVNDTEPNFVLFGQTPSATIRKDDGTPVCVGSVSGWSNTLNDTVVITFKPNAGVSVAGLKTTIGYSIQNSRVIPDKVSFTINGSTGNEGKFGLDKYWAWDDLSSSYEVPFTVSDGRGHTKEGTIRYEINGRAMVEATNSAHMTNPVLKRANITYDGAAYKHGDCIDFPADNKEITISADAQTATLYFNRWEIDGTAIEDLTQNPLTFTRPDTFFTIRAIYAGKNTLSVTNEADAHGKAVINGDEQSSSVDLLTGRTATVAATADEGYEFVSWRVFMTTKTGVTLERTDTPHLCTSLTADDLYQSTITISIGANVQLLPVFKPIVSAVTITIDHSNSNEGTVTPADETVAVKPERQPLRLTATPADAYHFDKWSITYTASGETAAAADYVLTETGVGTATFEPTTSATQPMTVKALFKAYVPVTATIAETTHGSIQYNGKTYAVGEKIQFPDNTATVELTVIPDEGYQAYAWTIGNETKYGNPLSLQLPKTDFTISVLCARRISYQVLLNENKEDITNSPDAWKEGSVGIYPLELHGYDATMTFDDAVSNLDSLKYLSTNAVLPSGRNVLVVVKNVLGIKKQFVLDSVELTGAEKIGEKTENGVLYCAFTMPDQDVTITINVHDKANVQIHAVPDELAHGTVTLTPTGEGDGSYYKEGTVLSLTATAASGYRFKEWQEADGSSYISANDKTKSSVQFTVGNTGAEITAIFEEAEKIDVPTAYAVTPENKAEILVNGGAQAATAKEGSILNLSVTNIDEFYLFDHWEIKDSSGNALILETESKNSSIALTVPNDAGGITIKAVLKERLIKLSSSVTLDGRTSSDVAPQGSLRIYVNDALVQLPAYVKKGDKIRFEFTLNDPASYVLDEVRALSMRSGSASTIYRSLDYTDEFVLSDWTLDGEEIKSIMIQANVLEKTQENTRYNINLTQPSVGGTIRSSNQTAKAGTSITLTAVPASGYALKTWTVMDGNSESVAVTPDSSNANQATFTMPAADVAVTAEFEEAEVVLPVISNVQLLRNPDKTVLTDDVTLDEETATWTITLPSDTDQTVLDNLTMQYLKITHSGASVSQMRGTDAGHDDATLEPKWSSGNVMCNMELNTPARFTVTAADGVTKKIYTIKIVHEGADKPVLSNGSANRTSDTDATVMFTSSAAGRYYYKVVASGAAEPDNIDTGTSGTAVVGNNKITLTNLTKEARDIYIVVKAADGTSSDMLKIEIPAFGAEEDGQYTIKYAGPKGGTVIPSKAKANAGETITLTIVPDNGKQMKAGTLTYTVAVTNGETVSITGTSFVMPENNVTISCKWEDATTPGGDTTIGGITAFTIDGVAGVVDNTTNTISVVMAYGTDVTKLIPIISGNNIASISPASGQMVDFTNSVRYTVTLTDGTVKYYTVTVYVQEGTAADKMWDKLTDFYDQTPWWEYADHQVSTGHYPKYW